MKQKGFTILEFLISMFIGMLILGGVIVTYVSMKSTTRDTMAIGELQEQYGMKWRDKVYAIHLNTNTVDNVKFKRKVEKTLKSIETNLKIEQRLALNLLPNKKEI